MKKISELVYEWKKISYMDDILAAKRKSKAQKIEELKLAAKNVKNIKHSDADKYMEAVLDLQKMEEESENNSKKQAEIGEKIKLFFPDRSVKISGMVDNPDNSEFAITPITYDVLMDENGDLHFVF
ncbi:hypothetical protein [Parasegetibacter sp. NRK P23]|uniref:hypothetical protein n=1 Tax=Parasegetibacter sp. NRK P23 TaxID=2942999 RepID=UPI00204458D5|nr:hypothetical protein [Parasegetibacter sp. NRK P23]MCM5528954.1 hypothetical protein [Parasegetibacter sp. NRK P23]